MKATTKIWILIFVLSSAASAQDIFEAIRNRDLTKVKELVERDPTLIKARNARKSTPLHVAVDANYQPIARFFIEKGAELNAVNQNLWTPLYYVKNAQMAKLLVDNGADINFDNSNITPLAISLFNKRTDVAEYLLERGAKIPEMGTIQALGFLKMTLRSGSSKFLDKYIRLGFNALYESEAKRNLLHYAAESDSSELVDYLINRGISPNKFDVFGLTPLHLAAWHGNLRVVRTLVQKGLDINARTKDGKTPLSLAAEAKKNDVAEYLRSAGADQLTLAVPILTGEYLGQSRPAKQAVPFGLGTINPLHQCHGSITFSPDGNEIFWSAYQGYEGTFIFFAKKVDGKWTKPEIFSKGDVPFISPDGQKLYFLAGKQVAGGTKEVIWVREKTDSGWSEPVELPEIVNSVSGIHWQVSVDRKGNLYFGASREGGTDLEDRRIYCSGYSDGQYGKPRIVESLKDVSAFSPYIAADGSYLIITRQAGTHDLILHFRKADGTWTRGIELAEYLGVEGAFCSTVSPDGNVLFFIRSLDGNDIPYWVDASFIEELRKKALAQETARAGRSAAWTDEPAREFREAVKAGNLAAAKTLLEKEPRIISSRDERGMAPLHFAAINRRVDILRLLVEQKADLEIRDDSGRTPLAWAIMRDAGVEVVGALLDSGANIETADRFGWTPLLYAAQVGNTEVVASLLARNAALPIATPNGRRLLQLAVQNGMTHLLSLLIAKGADVRTVDQDGTTLLHAAAAGGHTEIIESLLAQGLDINQRGNGWTPLHYAADRGHVAAVELLIARGADLHARTAVMGQTAANLAEESGNKEILAQLAAKGLALGPPDFPELRGEYLGQKKPGRKAEFFAPGIVNIPQGLHSSIVFSPDGREALWSFAFHNDRTMISRLEDGRWSYPRLAVFEGTPLEDVPFYHPDGKTLYDLARRRPLPDGRKSDRETIWVWERGENGWRNPKSLPAEVNDPPHHWQFSVDRQGTIYFRTRLPDSLGGNDIYMCRMIAQRYQKPENLGQAINTPADEGFPFISPDGRYLLFVRDTDIYVSFRDQAGQWGEAKALGPEVNTPAMEILPTVSPDGQYLFFTRGGRIYWIEASVIDNAR